jgi:hypothetical protein
MSGGRKTDDDKGRIWVTEAGYASPPIDIVAVGGTFFSRDLFSPVDEARTRATRCYLFCQHVESSHRRDFTARHRSPEEPR